MTDLADIAGRLPVPVGQAEHVARMLDRLGEEIAQAAAMLRDEVAKMGDDAYGQTPDSS